MTSRTRQRASFDELYDPSNLFHLNQNIPAAGGQR
jgi:hypothetical protein